MLLELVTLNVESKDHNKKSGLTKEDGKLLKGALTFKVCARRSTLRSATVGARLLEGPHRGTTLRA